MKWGKVVDFACNQDEMSEYSTPMSCFMGTYMHSLDPKGRLTVPRRFREGFSAGGMITRGIDSCLELMPTAAWSVKAERVANLDEFRREGRNARRALFANAAPLEFDKQGRISIPAPLREMVGIAKDVAVVGAGERVEIWCAQQWAALQADLPATIADTFRAAAEGGPTT